MFWWLLGLLPVIERINSSQNQNQNIDLLSRLSNIEKEMSELKAIVIQLLQRESQQLLPPSRPPTPAFEQPDMERSISVPLGGVTRRPQSPQAMLRDQFNAELNQRLSQYRSNLGESHGFSPRRPAPRRSSLRDSVPIERTPSPEVSYSPRLGCQ